MGGLLLRLWLTSLAVPIGQSNPFEVQGLSQQLDARSRAQQGMPRPLSQHQGTCRRDSSLGRGSTSRVRRHVTSLADMG